MIGWLLMKPADDWLVGCWWSQLMIGPPHWKLSLNPPRCWTLDSAINRAGKGLRSAEISHSVCVQCLTRRVQWCNFRSYTENISSHMQHSALFWPCQGWCIHSWPYAAVCVCVCARVQVGVCVLARSVGLSHSSQGRVSAGCKASSFVCVCVCVFLLAVKLLPALFS